MSTAVAAAAVGGMMSKAGPGGSGGSYPSAPQLGQFQFQQLPQLMQSIQSQSGQQQDPAQMNVGPNYGTSVSSMIKLLEANKENPDAQNALQQFLGGGQ